MSFNELPIVIQYILGYLLSVITILVTIMTIYLIKELTENEK